jgi:hypothetical protein
MPAIGGGKYCFTHSPRHGQARKEAHALGGQRTRADHGSEPEALPLAARSMADVLKILDYTLAEIKPLENSIIRARALVAIVSTYAEMLEKSELEQRITALENALLERIKK